MTQADSGSDATLESFRPLPFQCSAFSIPEVGVRKLTAVLALAALVATGACKKTGEGEYEVQKPVVGTQTDTVTTPTVDVGTTKDTINVPKVTTEKKEVTVPTVDVNKPK